MQETSQARNHGKRSGRTGLLLTGAALGLAALCVLGLSALENYRRQTQMQNDPRVARVWIADVTFGEQHQLKRGATLQQWLNSHHISFLGNYEVLQSQFSNDPGSAEIWFNYESYLIGRPDLECHRVRMSGTAFTDDLGQPYHGFLDIHGNTVGVYLPGYDHAARQIRCVLQWMPRRPALPYPVSRPMAFTIALPSTRRLLPPAAGLPRVVSVAHNGITVTVDAARLGPPKLTNGVVGQRDLSFHVKIDGGDIANDNVTTDGLDLSALFPASSTRWSNFATTTMRRLFRSAPPAGASGIILRQYPSFGTVSFNSPLRITDPYGISLLPPGQSLTPLITKENLLSAREGRGMVWFASVNNAGKGTDVIRLRLDVVPKGRQIRGTQVRPAQVVPFDLLLPVQTGDEV